MRCCICASGCTASTTNSPRPDEGAEHEKKETAFHCTAGDPRDRGLHGPGRLHRPEPVELAHAGALRLAPGHLLAGARAADAVPDPVRWIQNARPRPFPVAAPHARALGGYDSGRAGTIPAKDARALGLRAV